jgi:hypothetical protein
VQAVLVQGEKIARECLEKSILNCLESDPTVTLTLDPLSAQPDSEAEVGSMGSTDVHSSVLDRLEREHPDGLTSAAILDFFSSLGIRFSEAALRKWVQLGLLPRSVRVGRKGKHSGSQGMYPATILRQILRIKEMMADDLTIEQIQREVLFVRGDIEELERSLGRIFLTLDDALRQVRSETLGHAIGQEVAEARELAARLVRKLETIEARLMSKAAGRTADAATG